MHGAIYLSFLNRLARISSLWTARAAVGRRRSRYSKAREGLDSYGDWRKLLRWRNRLVNLAAYVRTILRE